MEERHPKKLFIMFFRPKCEVIRRIVSAREYLDGPTLMTFSDTLIETDLSFLSGNQQTQLPVQPVPDPRRFGVVETGGPRICQSLIEKPKELSNNCRGRFLLCPQRRGFNSSVEEQFKRDIHLGGEYFLTRR